jgi:[acyl-carrier-protein] S-malonyltransferase
MLKIACIFPGQGSQYIGMGKEIAEKYKVAMDIFDRADEKLGIRLKDLCFNGIEEELKKTENTQPSILTVSIALLEVLKLNGVKPQITAGLSLGEYSALVASNAIKFEDAVEIVKKRGRFMQDAVPRGEGSMAAVIGLLKDEIFECLKMASGYGIVEPVNFNCPKQVVIAGQVKAVQKASQLLKEKGARKVIELPVSAPFHSSMLKSAGERLSKELEKIDFSDMDIPVISNVNAQIIKNKYEIKKLLIDQVSSSVLWEDCVKNMIGLGVDTFIEVGPGNTLSAFVKKIDKGIDIYNVEDIGSLDRTINSLRERLECC